MTTDHPSPCSRTRLSSGPAHSDLSSGQKSAYILRRPELVLIQKDTHCVSPSVYAIATILLTLLVSSGIGSRSHENCRSAPLPCYRRLVVSGHTSFQAADSPLFIQLSQSGRFAVTALTITPPRILHGHVLSRMRQPVYKISLVILP